MKTRKELYDEIKTLGLVEEIKAKYNRHFTNVSTKDLVSIIDSHKTTKTKKVDSKKSPSMVGTTEAKFAKLVEILSKKRILLKSEVDAICNA